MSTENYRIYDLGGNRAVKVGVDGEYYSFSHHKWICVSFTRGCIEESGEFTMVDVPSIIPLLACDDMVRCGDFDSLDFHVDRIRRRLFEDGERYSRLYCCDGKDDAQYYADIEELHRCLEDLLKD